MWAKQGAYVLPIKEDKHPLLSRWEIPEAGCSRDPKRIRAWSRHVNCTGFGELLGQVSGEAVIDIDAHRDGTDEGLGLTTTLVVESPHGGAHHHYLTDQPVRSSKDVLAPGVEVLGDGRMAILPGSRIKLEDGTWGIYTLKRPIESRAELPAHLVRPRSEKAADGGSGPPGGVSEPSRHKTMLDYAVSLGHRGLSDDEMLALVMRYDKLYNDPPKNKPQEIRDIVKWVREHVSPDEADIDKLAREMRNRDEARRRIAAEQADREFDASVLPEGTADDFFAEPDLDEEFSIDGWHVVGGNTLLVAQFKSGKSTVAVNATYSLVTREPFLDKYPVRDIDGRVGYFNYELIDNMMRAWMRDRGLEGHDRLAHPLNLRGKRLNLASPHVRAKVVEWLKRNEVKFWILDTATLAWRGVVDNENSNSDAIKFTDIVDEMKYEAGVDDLLITHHQGRAVFAEGQERSRGATRLEDWMDSGWYLNKDDDGVRFLRSIGRGTDNDAVMLSYYTDTHRLTAGASRSDVKFEPWIENVVRRVADNPGIHKGGKGGLEKTRSIGGNKYRGVTIQKAIDRRLIRVEFVGQAQTHYVTEAGEKLLSHRVSIVKDED